MVASQGSRKILITGLPGSGKTTLVEKVVREFQGRISMAGFITREIREEGRRTGFELLSLDGQKAVLSHTRMSSPYRVGQYRVDLKGFENFLERLHFFDPESRLIVVDEIGKMECLSEKFRQSVLKVLYQRGIFLATIGLYGTPFIEKVKSHPDVEIHMIDQANRESIAAKIAGIIRSVLEFEP